MTNLLSEIKKIKTEGGLRKNGQFKKSNINRPLITIITVVMNGAQFLENTILSVIEQSYENIEFIIIDGGSSDKTLEIIKKYEHVIDYWISENDNGIYDAMNKGINLSSGEWINFMNAGDLLINKNIVKSIFIDKKCRSKFIYGDAVITDNKNEYLLKAKRFSYMNIFIWGTRTVCHQSIFVNKVLCIKYDEKLKLKAELQWYFNVLEQCTDHFKIQEPICKYLLGGITEKKFLKEINETLIVLLNINIIYSFLHLPALIYKILKRIFR